MAQARTPLRGYRFSGAPTLDKQHERPSKNSLSPGLDMGAILGSVGIFIIYTLVFNARGRTTHNAAVLTAFVLRLPASGSLRNQPRQLA